MNATDPVTMEVDEDASTQGPIDEGHGGVKRKAGGDAEPTAKKLRMGMFTTLCASAADNTMICRIARYSIEEVNLINSPLTINF